MRADSKNLPLREDPEAIATSPANILDRVTDGFVALDTNWRYTYVNRQAALLFGRRPQDLIGRHIWTEFPEGIGQPFHLAYEKALAEQVFIQIESFYEPWKRWFENRIHPSPDGVSIFFHEITARKQAEQEAHQSAELLKGQNAVLELISSGAPLQQTLDVLLRLIETHCPGVLGSIVLLDADGVHVRHGAAPSLPDSFVQAVDGQPIGPRAGSCGTAAFRREPVIVEDISSDPLWADYREVALRHDLRACWSTPIFDSKGNVLGTFALYFRTPAAPTEWHHHLIELTTHTAAIALVKHRETEALRASEERLRLAVTGGNVGIWEWDVATGRLLCSEELRAVFGWGRETDLTLEAFFDVLHPEDRAHVERALRSRSRRARRLRSRVPHRLARRLALLDRRQGSRRIRCGRQTGTECWASRRKSPIRNARRQSSRRRQTQLAEAQRIAQLGSYEWDIPANTVYRSEELCRIFGLAPGRVSTDVRRVPGTRPSRRSQRHAVDRRAGMA